MGPIIFDITGHTLNEEDCELIRHPLIGGVIFFSRNYESPEQMIALVQSIRAIRPSLLLCVDQEGGRVQRFKAGVSKLPHLRSLGNKVDQGETLEAQRLSYRLGRLMALEIRSLGLDLSFAPVLDLDRGVSEVIGDRSFHRDPSIVSTLAITYMKGMKEVGMQAVGKHFPGHGAVSLDSHHALPIDERSFDEIEEAKNLGYKNIYLESMPELKQALKTYEKFGFQYLKGPMGNSGHYGCELWMIKYL